MTLQSIPSEFPYIWGKFYFIFFSGTVVLPNGSNSLTKKAGVVGRTFVLDRAGKDPKNLAVNK
jgi:hypothetical protein